MSNLTPLVVSYKTEMAHCRSDAIRLRLDSFAYLPTKQPYQSGATVFDTRP
jgi:hypothetical protein